MISEKELMLRLAEALDVDPDAIRRTTRASEITRWDSMGTMAIVLMLTEDFGIQLEPKDTARLQSVESILQLMREAGHIS
jgi:acyl carrier protein